VAQEFHISVTPLGAQDEYLVRIERVAPGVPLAEEQVKWSVEDWLAQSQQLMNDPLLGLLQGSGNLPVTQPALNLVALGQKLYNALFQGSLRDSWIMAQAIAENQRAILRLRLGLRGTRLSRLPWEVLHAGDRPLATGTDVAFSRYQLSTALRTSPSLTFRQNQPLKILMVIASPSDKESLELKQEANHLQEELRTRFRNGSPTIQLKILEQPGREQLTHALEQGQYQVFHYAGHSNPSVAGGDLYLVSSKTGLTETLNGDDLAGLLVNNGIQLAVFNSCRGAYTASLDTSDPSRDQNLAQALIKRGIPSVLAMAERIPDEVALILTRLFYRNLNQGYPIDLSLSRARQGLISAYGSNQLYWALPVLYLHPQFDGFLISPDDPASRFAIPDSSETFLANGEVETLFTEPPGNRSHPEILNTADTTSLEDFGAVEDWYEDESTPHPISSDPLFFSSNSEYDEDIDPIYSDVNGNPSDYEADLAIVSDLFRQLSQAHSIPDEPIVSASAGENLLPQPTDSPPVSDVYQRLPENPEYSQRAQVPASAITQPSEVASKSRSKVKKAPRFQIFSYRSSAIFWLLSTLGAVAIALLGLWFWQNRNSQTTEVLSHLSHSTTGSQAPISNLKAANLQKVETGTLVTVAIDQFNQGNLSTGQQAVEELLNRNALPQSAAALAVVPKNQEDTAAISFLKGRLAWQSLSTGSKDFSLDDVRRFWEVAVKKQPNSSLYLNALGFAYYEEGNVDRAIQVWFDALSLKEKQSTNVSSVGGHKDILTTYAGLAIGLKRSSQTQPEDKQANLVKEAMKLRQKILNDDPVHFQPEALSKNWMWSEKAIQDWQALLTSQS
jgi:tetratricopeptide (TPR) repeat protein